jgi:hypothetical protein
LSPLVEICLKSKAEKRDLKRRYSESGCVKNSPFQTRLYFLTSIKVNVLETQFRRQVTCVPMCLTFNELSFKLGFKEMGYTE